MQGTFVRDLPPHVKKILPPVLASPLGVATIFAQASDIDVGQQFTITIVATTGNVFINPLEIATTTNSLRLAEKDSMDLTVVDALSVISNSTSAKVQGYIWKFGI